MNAVHASVGTDEVAVAVEMLHHLNNPCGFCPTDRAQLFLRYAQVLPKFHDSSTHPEARAIYRRAIESLPERIEALRRPMAGVFQFRKDPEGAAGFLEYCTIVRQELERWLAAADA